MGYDRMSGLMCSWAGGEGRQGEARKDPKTVISEGIAVCVQVYGCGAAV